MIKRVSAMAFREKSQKNDEFSPSLLAAHVGQLLQFVSRCG